MGYRGSAHITPRSQFCHSCKHMYHRPPDTKSIKKTGQCMRCMNHDLLEALREAVSVYESMTILHTDATPEETPNWKKWSAAIRKAEGEADE